METKITHIIEDLTEVEKETKERQTEKDCDEAKKKNDRCEKGPWRHSLRQIKGQNHYYGILGPVIAKLRATNSITYLEPQF